ncbi:MAG: DUF1292 domain-containing protein [Bacillota bacterium]|jgi:hypothetical protein|nr:DUF1292 domain-containing protein [Bacillota bacterium]HOC05768.1 DUF1292 domain-containing protein [Bacillota bacterium]HPZ21464.1 DUF1292 domain-containing protein [Bacillota bacterium]HQD19326.1 DUF1292 domain-containing protein [Bacillota bacterium]
MTDDSDLIHLYNEEDNQVLQFIEYKRLAVKGRIYALLQPEDDLEQLVAFRVEEAEDGEDVYIYVVDSDELDAVDEAWKKLHS